MEESVRLGRIAGIPVGLNWSLLVVFWLITWGLAGGWFPSLFPDHSPGAYWAAALVTAVFFYCSLLAHEVGHALVARRNGVGVQGITLWLFGGVAKLEGEAMNPRAALRIAGIGPLVSFGVAGLSTSIAALLIALDAPELAVGVFAWLAVINVILAVFNLVPAAPLDGGRILQGLLWLRHGDRVRASLSASRAGRTFGFVLIGLGLLQFAVGAFIGGVWMVFLGWFLMNAARAEERDVLMRGALDGVSVRDVMSPDPVVGPDWLTVDAFLDEYVMRNRFSAFPVNDWDGALSGLVTLGRLKEVVPERRHEVRVGDVACPLEDVPTAAPGEPMVDLLARMDPRSDGRALVLEGDRLVGIVSPTDVARILEISSLVRRRSERTDAFGAQS
jgi:Zn-dependent protease/CBS domain-containing protein